VPTTAQARSWLDRWDRQQEFHIPDREERFTVIGDVLASVLERPDPLIVDLGAGPGSLAVRLLDRVPTSTVVAIDADPLLLGLARAAYGDRAQLRIVDHDLREHGWVAALDLPRPADAIVSTTALHWLTRDQLAAVYCAARTLLRPGGVFVDGDHLTDGSPALYQLGRDIAARRAARIPPAEREDWASWWDAAAVAPELAELTSLRGNRPLDHSVPDVPTLADHIDLLRTAGFGEVGTVWQHGDNRVLVALR